MTVRSEILEIISAMPASSSAEVIALMSHVKPQSVYSGLNSMMSHGEIKIVDENARPFKYVLGEGKPTKIKKKSKAAKKAVKPVDIGPNKDDIIKRLDQVIVELTTWKENAIRRHPDLNVPEIVYRARKLAAKQYAGDQTHYDNIMSGKCDNKPMILAIVDALEGVE